jgi:hypothetical protein
MIIEVLIAATQTLKPLGDQVLQGMCDAVRSPRIVQRLRYRL